MEHSERLISVVIPLYNKEATISRAVTSVLNQTFQNFELIIVDDGSEDDGLSIAAQFSDSRVKIIIQDNGGVSKARNRGIYESKGEIVAFLDADDEWKPEFLETIRRLSKKYPDAGIFGTAYETHFPDAVVKRVYREEEGERVIHSYFKALLESHSVIFNSSSFASPKDVLIEIGGFREGAAWNEDGLLWGLIALRHPIAYSPLVCSVYHQYSANNSAYASDYLENPMEEIINNIPGTASDNEIDAIRQYYEMTIMSCATRNIFSGYGLRTIPSLLSIKTPSMSLKKLILLMFAIAPSFFIGWVHNNAKKIGKVRRRVFQI